MKKLGYRVIDITVKSSTGIWRDAAPTWPMVLGYKRGTITKEQYTEKYKGIMGRFFFKHGPEILKFLENNKKIALACYCRLDSFCHRNLLAKELASFAAKNGLPTEWTKTPDPWRTKQ